MEAVDHSSYALLESRIRKGYRTLIDVGSSVIGHMGISCAAECAGSFFGGRLAARSEQYFAHSVQGYTQQYPLAFRTTVVCCGGALIHEIAQHRGFDASKRLAIVALVGLLAIPGVWQEFAFPIEPLVLCTAQVALRILLGYAGLVVTGVVPVFWKGEELSSCYAVRTLRLEVTGVILIALLDQPSQTDSWLHWTALMVFQIPFCFLLQTMAYHLDRLIPFTKQCVLNLKLGKQQRIVPQITHALIQRYAGSERELLVGTISKGFLEQFNDAVASLFPPFCYKLFGKILPIPGKDELEDKMLTSVEKNIDARVEGLLEYAEANNEFFARLTTHALVGFSRLMQEVPKLGEEESLLKKPLALHQLHRLWQQAYLYATEDHEDDQERTRKALTDGLDAVMRQQNHSKYPFWSSKVRSLCNFSSFIESLPASLQGLKGAEKELFGYTITQDLHIAYWQAACEIYLPYFLTYALLHYHDLQQPISPMDEKELLESVQAFLCDSYFDVTCPPKVRFVIRKILEGTVSVMEYGQGQISHLLVATEHRAQMIPAENQASFGQAIVPVADVAKSYFSAPEKPVEKEWQDVPSLESKQEGPVFPVVKVGAKPLRGRASARKTTSVKKTLPSISEDSEQSSSSASTQLVPVTGLSWLIPLKGDRTSKASEGAMMLNRVKKPVTTLPQKVRDNVSMRLTCTRQQVAALWATHGNFAPLQECGYLVQNSLYELGQLGGMNEMSVRVMQLGRQAASLSIPRSLREFPASLQPAALYVRKTHSKKTPCTTYLEEVKKQVDAEIYSQTLLAPSENWQRVQEGIAMTREQFIWLHAVVSNLIYDRQHNVRITPDVVVEEVVDPCTYPEDAESVL